MRIKTLPICPYISPPDVVGHSNDCLINESAIRKFPIQSWWRHQMKHFPRYWPFVRGLNRSLVNSPGKGQWRGALMFSFICVWINSWVNNRKAGDLRRYRAHYEVTVMIKSVYEHHHALWCATPTGCPDVYRHSVNYVWVSYIYETGDLRVHI